MALRDEIVERGIKSIAVPPLGCGNGGLPWHDVEPMIHQALGTIPGSKSASTNHPVHLPRHQCPTPPRHPPRRENVRHCLPPSAGTPEAKSRVGSPSNRASHSLKHTKSPASPRRTWSEDPRAPGPSP
ncbi:hypothetical protein GTY84_00110 [Streptomyces sp. SID8352]|nr:hypothetical protein [Streptomyces sp. SID8352]